MPVDIEETPRPTASELVGGIVGDLRHLVDQQLHLTWLEIEEESHLLKAALGKVALGAGVASLGALAACLMLVHLLHWLTSPVNSDPAALPLWACYALVATMLLVSGIILLQIGRSQLDSMELRRITRAEPSPEHVS